MGNAFSKWTEPTEIVPGLYLGGLEAGVNVTWIRDHDIGLIVDASNQSHGELKRRRNEVPHLDHVAIKVDDTKRANIYQYFDSVVLRIRSVLASSTEEDEKNRGGQRQGGRRGEEGRKRGVLVHCLVGKSRSATLVIAYLMYAYDWDVSEALAFVKSKRKMVKPNDGFLRQLHDYRRRMTFLETGSPTTNNATHPGGILVPANDTLTHPLPHPRHLS